MENAESDQDEMSELRMDVALLERACSELRGAIGSQELPGRTRSEIIARGNNPELRRADTPIEAFARMPHSCIALRENNVHSPKAFQKVAWPVLLQNDNTLLLAPQGAGKFMSLIPMIANHALTSLVVVASTRKRCLEYYAAFLNLPSMRPAVLETPIARDSGANIICCPYTALPRVVSREETFVCVFDGLDKLAEQGCTRQSKAILRVVRDRASRVLASARTSSVATVELAGQIGFRAVVSTGATSEATEQRCRIHVEVCRKIRTYDKLKNRLEERQLSEEVALVLVKDSGCANRLENQLGHDGVYAQSLHAEEDNDRELAESLLRAGQPGIFIAIRRDLSWLQEIDKVDLLIDLRGVRSPSAFAIRESRVRSSGMFVAFLDPNDGQTSTWLVPMLRHRKIQISEKLRSMLAAHSRLSEELLEN